MISNENVGKTNFKSQGLHHRRTPYRNSSYCYFGGDYNSGLRGDTGTCQRVADGFDAERLC